MRSTVRRPAHFFSAVQLIRTFVLLLLLLQTRGALLARPDPQKGPTSTRPLWRWPSMASLLMSSPPQLRQGWRWMHVSMEAAARRLVRS